MIKIKEKTIWRTMWGPCFGHKRVIFWQFLAKGDYGIHPDLWNLALIIPGHIDYNLQKNKWKDHVLAIKGPYFADFQEKGTMGYTKYSEIWHRSSLGTLIMIQEVPIWRTVWRPSFGYKRAIFWPFLRKGDYGIHQNCENWHGASLGKMIMIRKNQFEGPCEDNVWP